jgi:hypothetical protein
MRFKTFCEIRDINKQGYYVLVGKDINIPPETDDEDILATRKPIANRQFKELGPFRDESSAANAFQDSLNQINKDQTISHISLVHYEGDVTRRKDLVWWNSSSHSRLGFNERLPETQHLRHAIHLPVGSAYQSPQQPISNQDKTMITKKPPMP